MKTIWDKITGYKTYVSGALLLVLSGVKLIWPDVIDKDWYEWILNLLLFTGGVGVGDKIRRSTIKK